MKTSSLSVSKSALCGALVLVVAALGGCSDKAKEKKPGQALASVNGEEVTVLQLNEELQRANVAASQQDAASKQLLQVLIDRQLLQDLRVLAGVAQLHRSEPSAAPKRCATASVVMVPAIMSNRLAGAPRNMASAAGLQDSTMPNWSAKTIPSDRSFKSSRTHFSL